MIYSNNIQFFIKNNIQSELPNIYPKLELNEKK